MAKINTLTAQEFINTKDYRWVEDVNVNECMIEFAQIHVQKALKEASKKAKRREGTIADNNLTKSILNSYPLTKIN